MRKKTVTSHAERLLCRLNPAYLTRRVFVRQAIAWTRPESVARLCETVNYRNGINFWKNKRFLRVLLVCSPLWRFWGFKVDSLILSRSAKLVLILKALLVWISVDWTGLKWKLLKMSTKTKTPPTNKSTAVKGEPRVIVNTNQSKVREKREKVGRVDKLLHHRFPFLVTKAVSRNFHRPKSLQSRHAVWLNGESSRHHEMNWSPDNHSKHRQTNLAECGEKWFPCLQIATLILAVNFKSHGIIDRRAHWGGEQVSTQSNKAR